jgi:formyltetrahydrofolate-dependent phosphoribosylglycinamide formyltransferase
VSAANLGVLVSGTGRSLENLCERIARGELAARIALVLADREGTLALERARRLELPHLVVQKQRDEDVPAFSRRVFGALEAHAVELAVLAGFLRLLRVPERWAGRVINIHPALLPRFGGKGMYGERVHQAVLASGASESGCTVHFVDDQYDHGPIVLQRRVPVLPGDDAHALAARVFAEEQEALPEAIRRVLAGEARWPGSG